MRIEGNSRIRPATAPPTKVAQGDVRFGHEKPRDNSALIGMLSKYTNRTDLSTLISDRDAW